MHQSSRKQNLPSRSNDDCFFLSSGGNSNPLTQVVDSNTMTLPSSTSAYVFATAKFLSKILQERPELLGNTAEALRGVNDLTCWGENILAPRDDNAPFVQKMVAAANKGCRFPCSQQEVDACRSINFNPSQLEDECNERVLDSDFSLEEVHDPGCLFGQVQGDDEVLCLTSKYIVLEESIPDTVKSTDTEYSTDEDNCLSDEDNCKYELFDDVSVLTADSSMEELHEELAVESTNSHHLQGFQDCGDHHIYNDLKSVHQAAGLEHGEHLASCDSAGFQDEPRYLDAMEPSMVYAHAADDLRLTSFLLNFCTDGSG